MLGLFKTSPDGSVMLGVFVEEDLIASIASEIASPIAFTVFSITCVSNSIIAISVTTAAPNKTH